jgi:hypothetical protein
MELQGSVTLPASPALVWQALNDPEVLRACIPGCEEVRRISPEELHARVMLKLGPVRANFVGKVKITDVRPLQGYTLNFEGSGGSAGFAKGSSVVTLTAQGESTQLDYTAQASVAGKLGQIGGRMIDASAKQLAGLFFNALKSHMTPDTEEQPSSDTSSATAGLAPQTGSSATASAVKLAQGAPHDASQGHWFDREKSRLLWFFAGCAATALGAWIGSHGLR